MRANRTAASMPAADEDYFHDMDGGLALTRDEVQGRNMWLVWTGGNDRFWDAISATSFGTLDFLKTVSSHPSMSDYSRDNRWTYLGLVNEPCFTKATAPDPARYGLWLDNRDPNCPPDPFANGTKYPGIALGARGKTVPVGSYYGEPTGIVGLRLFPESGVRRGRPGRSGTPSATTAIPTITSRRISSSRIASACRARSVTSARIRSGRPPIPRIPDGRT